MCAMEPSVCGYKPVCILPQPIADARCCFDGVDAVLDWDYEVIVSISFAPLFCMHDSLTCDFSSLRGHAWILWRGIRAGNDY